MDKITSSNNIKVKMKKVLLFVVILTNYTYSQDANQNPYQFFPANVGDRWEYTYAGPDQFYFIARDSIDTKDSSRIIFYDGWTTYNPIKSRYPLYRIDKNFNVFYDPLRDNRHFYKLDAKVGESWIVKGGENKAAKVLYISQAYVFGKITTVKAIGFFILTRGDTVITENSILQYWDKLAYGFGLISREDGATQPYLLRGCRINGVTYGLVNVADNSNEIPTDFVLHQNYPNPFNPTTTISFSLPKYSQIIIKVFDLLGREIQVLVNDYFNPGVYKVEFNARNLSSGVYFYRLITDKTARTFKMILNK